MNETYTIKACCALCEYLWDDNNCPMCGTFRSAKTCDEITEFEDDMKYRMICDEFEISSKWRQPEKENTTENF